MKNFTHQCQPVMSYGGWGGRGGGGGPNLEKVVKLAVVYYNHFNGVRFVVKKPIL